MNGKSLLELDMILAAWSMCPNVSRRARGPARRREAVSCCLVRQGTQSTIHFTHIRSLRGRVVRDGNNKVGEVEVIPAIKREWRNLVEPSLEKESGYFVQSNRFVHL
jgi:hypothetical protein